MAVVLGAAVLAHVRSLATAEENRQIDWAIERGDILVSLSPDALVTVVETPPDVMPRLADPQPVCPEGCDLPLGKGIIIRNEQGRHIHEIDLWSETGET